MSSHNEVAKKFGQRIPNKRKDNKVVWSASNVFCEHDVIYSYGRHFPIAQYLGEHPKYGHFFLKNSNKYSGSTSAHQSCVGKYCPGPRVSRNSFSEYDLEFTKMKMDSIYLWRPGVSEFIWFDTETQKYYKDAEYVVLQPTDAEPTTPWISLDEAPNPDDLKKAFSVVKLERRIYNFVKPVKLSRFGSFKLHRKQTHGRFQTGSFTVQEVLVLKVKKHYYLSVDGGKISKLPGQPKTIAEALKMGVQKRSLVV